MRIGAKLYHIGGTGFSLSGMIFPGSAILLNGVFASRQSGDWRSQEHTNPRRLKPVPRTSPLEMRGAMNDNRAVPRGNASN
jgi:hypothetical protein